MLPGIAIQPRGRAEGGDHRPPVVLKLFASTSARDTDFTAKLVDVRPGGTAFNVVDGVTLARFRESLSQPTLVTPGEVVEYAIDMWSTSHMFLPAHRIRLTITSSDFPRYDRNPNTGNDSGTDTVPQKAEQTIFHDARFASHVVLPIIPD